MRYLGQRLIHFILVFVIVTFAVLAFTRMGSTDPARDLAGGLVTEERIAQVEADYPYLDDPLPVQWVYWMKDVLTGDFGYSYIAIHGCHFTVPFSRTRQESLARSQLPHTLRTTGGIRGALGPAAGSTL